MNNNNKEIENEKDIEIVTLPDSKLQIFTPPTSIGLTSNYMIPKTPNLNITSNSLFDPERTNFTFCSKIEYLGVGGFSKVFKYRGDIENKAVKKIFADPKYYSKKLTAEDSIKREIFGMKKINCNNSLKVYGIFQNEDKDTYYMLLELCDGNMEKYIKDRGYPLNIFEIINLLNQLNHAFYLLEINNIIHRDIKPSNILYKEDKNIDPHNKRINKKIFEGKKLTFKIGDYGVCIPLYDKNYSKSQFMGTLDFMAPEIYEMKCEKEHPIYTKKIDVFSLGQSILCLMGYIKKASALNSSMIEELKKNCDLFKGNRKEKMLADLIFNYLLVVDPEKRADWMTYFNHPLFEDNNVCNQIKDENIKRLEKKYIKRNSQEGYKIEIPKNNKLYKYVSKEKREKEKENKENTDKECVVIYNKNTNKNKGNNVEKDVDKENVNLYNKNKKNLINNINDKINIKKKEFFYNNRFNLDNKMLYNKNKNNSTSNINIENNINKQKSLTYKINEKQKENNINTINKKITDIRIKYIKNNLNEKGNIKILPFNSSKFNIEKNKTYTNQNVNGIISYNILENKNKNDKNKSFEKNKNIDKNNNNKNNYNNNINKNKKDEKKNPSRIIVICNNKSHKYFTKFRNKSNIDEILQNRNNLNNSNNENKSFETHNHFYSVRNKYKKLAHKNDNIIRNNLTKMPIVKEVKENPLKKKYNKELNMSQNLSPKNAINNINKINNNTNNINIFEERRFNSVYEVSKNHPLYNNRYNYYTNKITNKDKEEKVVYSKNKIKFQKLKKDILPYNRFSKSQIKYSNTKSFNSNKNNMTMTEAYKNKKKIQNNKYKSNNITLTEINLNPSINNEISLKGDKNNNSYNKISYVLNSNSLKNKSITYFNIRVVNDKVEENLHKINKNNGFYFSKYSRYNNDY